MNIFSAANIPQEDSIEYKLLNLRWGDFSAREDRFDIYYARGSTEVSDHLTYEQLATIHPDFVALAKQLQTQYSRDETKFAKTLAASVAFLLKSYHEVSEVDLACADYPFITQVTRVESHRFTDVFIVECLSFKLNTELGNGLVTTHTNPLDTVYMPSAAIDKVWPGSSKTIPMLESLGYSSVDVVKALYDSSPLSPVLVSLPDIHLD